MFSFNDHFCFLPSHFRLTLQFPSFHLAGDFQELPDGRNNHTRQNKHEKRRLSYTARMFNVAVNVEVLRQSIEASNPPPAVGNSINLNQR